MSHVLCRLPYINLKRVKRSTTTGRSASATARLSHHAETGAWVGKCIERLSESVVAHPWRRAVGEMWLLVVFHMARAAKVQTRIKAAVEALPFVHPKLAVTGLVAGQDFATLLEERLKKIHGTKPKRIEQSRLELEL